MKRKATPAKLVYALAITCAVAATLAMVSPADAQNKPPQPVGGPVRYSTLRTTFDNGTPTNEQMLRGTWIELAVATNQACGEVRNDEQDAAGIKNDDKSPMASLVFGDTEYLEIDIARKVFSVTILNLGKKDENQGPYLVNPAEPQFSTFAYNYDYKKKKWVQMKTYFSYRCRSIAGAQDRMICGASYIRGKSEIGGKTCAESGIGMISVYKKIQ